MAKIEVVKLNDIITQGPNPTKSAEKLIDLNLERGNKICFMDHEGMVHFVTTTIMYDSKKFYDLTKPSDRMEAIELIKQSLAAGWAY